MMETNKPLLFVGGDISGIQKFIYNISSKKAMVSLKGRSAYLVRYTKEICDGILGLPEVQESACREVVYCSGGKFYLIVEDGDAVRKAIDGYYRQLEKGLWNEHKGQLGLAIAYVPFRMSDHGGVEVDGVHFDQIGILWARISDRFLSLKNKKFLGVFQEDYDSFFKVIPNGGDTRICAVTGIEDKHCVRLDKDTDGDEIWVLPSVKKQVEIGKELRKQDGFKTLEEYAGGTYVGVLRMDVDGLGARFVKGFLSFEEYSAFSRKLSDFFDVRLKEIQGAYKDSLNIVYAGGDDLFVVGHWNKVLEFADEVRRRFAEHMSGENVTISGGMAIVSEKFPIAKSAEMSGRAEAAAKLYHQGRKNAFSFLGECVSWEQEFGFVKELKEEFVRQIQENDVSTGLLHQLMRYGRMASEGKDLSYKWHETYYLTRAIERSKKNEGAKAFLIQMRKDGISRHREEYRLVSLAARWAELQLRDGKKDNN